MSGGHDLLDTEAGKEIPEQVKKLMLEFSVDEKTARRLISYFTCSTQERVDKWIRNIRKLQKDRADEIYRLLKRLKKGDKSVIDEIEKKILKICVERDIDERR